MIKLTDYFKNLPIETRFQMIEQAHDLIGLRGYNKTISSDVLNEELPGYIDMLLVWIDKLFGWHYAVTLMEKWMNDGWIEVESLTDLILEETGL